MRRKEKMSLKNKVKYTNQQEIFEIVEKEGVTYLEFKGMQNLPIIHGFSTRLGGVSQGIYSSMNLSYTRGDDERAVTENFHRMAKALAVDSDSFVLSDQTHTTNIRRVGVKDKGKGLTRERDYQDIDGLITNEPGITLACFYADCVPLFFVDVKHQGIGLAHSGWKGTVGAIGRKMVETMEKEFDSQPEDIIVGIGPSICRECYEVSEDVALEFKKIFTEEEHRSIMDEKEHGKYQLDLWECNRRILRKSGILSEHIYVSNICTCCNPEFLFSHRASQGKRGNLGAFLALK